MLGNLVSNHSRKLLPTLSEESTGQGGATLLWSLGHLVEAWPGGWRQDPWGRGRKGEAGATERTQQLLKLLCKADRGGKCPGFALPPILQSPPTDSIGRIHPETSKVINVQHLPESWHTIGSWEVLVKFEFEDKREVYYSFCIFTVKIKTAVPSRMDQGFGRVDVCGASAQLLALSKCSIDTTNNNNPYCCHARQILLCQYPRFTGRLNQF